MVLLSISIKKIIIWLIHGYQISISSILNHHCRFNITCSQFCIKSIRRFGILKGSWITLIRILQCHPITLNRNLKYTNKLFPYLNQDIVNIMDSQRNFFIITFLVISLILWQTWESEHHQNFNTENTKIYNTPKPTLNNNINNTHPIQPIDCLNNIITIETDVFLLKINTYGGNIEEAYLKNYLEDLHSTHPLHLLSHSKEFIYQENSGLIIDESPLKNPFNNNQIIYTTENNQKKYTLSKNDNILIVTLKHTTINGIKYTKNYIFNRNNYSINIYYTIHNTSNNPLQAKLFGNLIQSTNSNKSHHNKYNETDSFPLYSYRGAAYSTDKNKYQKYSFKDIKNANLNVYTSKGWIAMLQKYFIAAWLPLTPGQNKFFTTYIDDNTVSINFKSDTIKIPENEICELKSILWIGPKIQKEMKATAPHLDLVIDYGWLWFISQPLFELLHFIYDYVGNWGISIIIITLIIRLIMYPLTKAQYVSMAKIKMLQPKLAAIQETYKHDKYKYHQKTIALYKEEKANPLGGCLPLLIQMPIFLALYYMLSGSVELRHAKFAFWIHDLSAQDPYYILPILMGCTMFFIQKMSPTTINDPLQKKIMTIMLIIFTAFFLWFPSGLVLYYIVSNIITIIQQQIIYHSIEKNYN